MSMLFASGSSVHHGTAADATALLIAVVVTFAVVVGWLGRSLNTFRNPAAAPTRYRREVRREALNNVVRGWLLVAVLCPVMCVTLYAVIHAGSS